MPSCHQFVSQSYSIVSNLHALEVVHCSPFDEDKLIRGHSLDIFPPVVGIVTDTERLTIPVGVSQRDGSQILLRINAPEVAQSQWPIVGRDADRTPKVDNLETTFDEFRSVRSRKMTMNSSNGRLRSLVNVNLGDGLTLLRAVVDFSRPTSANGWIQILLVCGYNIK